MNDTAHLDVAHLTIADLAADRTTAGDVAGAILLVVAVAVLAFILGLKCRGLRIEGRQGPKRVTSQPGGPSEYRSRQRRDDRSRPRPHPGRPPRPHPAYPLAIQPALVPVPLAPRSDADQTVTLPRITDGRES